MRLGIVVNVMDSDEEGATTYRLAAEAVTKGHEVWIMSSGRLAYETNDTVQALASAVIVLNDPNGLAKAMNKLYLQTLPERVRPRTLVTRHLARVEEFLEDEGSIILKPLQGSGGTGVFIVRDGGEHNLQEIFKSISRDGYVVAQEYLPAAAEGDVRLFLMNGVPLQHKGKYAAFRRVRSGDDIRSNIHAGGRLRAAEVNATMLRLADMVRPRHRRRQAHGDQRLQPGRPGECAEV